MVAGKYKSGSKRKIFVKTPGSKTTVHYRNRKPKVAKCHGCGAELNGVPRAFKAELKNMPKTAKRPERPYGGQYCSSCTKIILKNKAR